MTLSSHFREGDRASGGTRVRKVRHRCASEARIAAARADLGVSGAREERDEEDGGRDGVHLGGGSRNGESRQRSFAFYTPLSPSAKIDKRENQCDRQSTQL